MAQDYNESRLLSSEELFAQYTDARNFLARAALNDLEIPVPGELPFNPEAEIIEALESLNISRHAKIIDMGTLNGGLPNHLAIRGFIGTVIGVDPYFIPQILNKKAIDVRYAKELLTLNNSSQISDPVINKIAKLLAENDESNYSEFIKANANDVPIKSGSTDVYIMKDMLYHLDDVLGALEEARRISKPAGLIVISTSGQNHKDLPRNEQRQIAEKLAKKTGTATIAPPRMNDGFTTETAKIMLPKLWKYVYMFNHEGFLRIDDEFSKELYRGHHYSLYCLYKPVPEIGVFEDAVEEVAIDTIGPEGKLVRSSRSIFLISNEELAVNPKKFVRIKAEYT